jgi:DNA (cytosine-5)-methyltransferase 1
MLRVLDLFSGIGGFSLGLERAGMKTVAFCEIDPYCQAVLKKLWPRVPVFNDVRTLCRRVWMNEPEDDEDNFVECTIHRGQDFGDCECIGTDQFTDTIGGVDLVCGGFPCQDISLIGRRAGLAGADSGLWFEQLRIINELEPRWVIIENVAALVDGGLAEVLRGLDGAGFDAAWFVIPASAVGAPHKRERLWIIANARGAGLEGHAGHGKGHALAAALRPAASADLLSGKDTAAWWQSEPGIRRVVDGVPAFVDRITCLGNAVVPQIPEMIGRAIALAEAQT